MPLPEFEPWFTPVTTAFFAEVVLLLADVVALAVSDDEAFFVEFLVVATELDVTALFLAVLLVEATVAFLLVETNAELFVFLFVVLLLDTADFLLDDTTDELLALFLLDALLLDTADDFLLDDTTDELLALFLLDEAIDLLIDEA